MRRYFNKVKRTGVTELLQQVVVTFAFFSESAIISDDHGMWVKLFHVKMFDVFSGCHPAKQFSEWYDHQMVNQRGKQADLFFNRVDQVYLRQVGTHHGARMRMKGDDHGFAANLCGYLLQLIKDLKVTFVHAIKSSDRQNRFPECR